MSTFEKITGILAAIASGTYIVIEVFPRIPSLANYISVQTPTVPNWLFPALIVIFVIFTISAHFLPQLAKIRRILEAKIVVSLQPEPRPSSAIEEPQIHLIEHNFLNKFMVKVDFEITAGQLPIGALEVQVAYGFPNPIVWKNLDLREYNFADAEEGKGGEPVQRISLLSNDVKRFTFVTIWYKDKKARIQATIRTIDSDSTLPGDFERISWLPWQRFHVRFIGLPKMIQKEYVILYNEPPWEIGSNINRRPVSLVEADSKLGKELIAIEKRKYG